MKKLLPMLLVASLLVTGGGQLVHAGTVDNIGNSSVELSLGESGGSTVFDILRQILASTSSILDRIGQPATNSGNTLFSLIYTLNQNINTQAAQQSSISDRIGQPATDTTEATGLYAMFGQSDAADSDAFLNGHTYSMGDYVIQGGQLYQCVVTTSSTSWVESEWMPVTGTSMVKSIQRGTASGSFSNFNVSISPVNPNRCIVLLNGGGAQNGNYGYVSDDQTVRLVSISKDYFTCRGGQFYGYGGTVITNWFSWQVIEFY